LQKPLAQPDLPVERFLSRAPAVFAAILGLSYVLGFIIVNLYLSRYNFAYFEILKARYLSAGLALIAIAGVLIIPIASEITKHSKEITSYWKGFGFAMAGILA
jgi:hypothetical protein